VVKRLHVELPAQVFTVRHGKQVRMQMYADPSEALDAAGLREWAWRVAPRRF
jgi:hypothetical protein